MIDERTKRASQDCKRINMSERYEVHYWSEKFGVSEDELQRAVDAFGNVAHAVESRMMSRG